MMEIESVLTPTLAPRARQGARRAATGRGREPGSARRAAPTLIRADYRGTSERVSGGIPGMGLRSRSQHGR
jgi:hypothetical protein